MISEIDLSPFVKELNSMFAWLFSPFALIGNLFIDFIVFLFSDRMIVVYIGGFIVAMYLILCATLIRKIFRSNPNYVKIIRRDD